MYLWYDVVGRSVVLFEGGRKEERRKQGRLKDCYVRVGGQVGEPNLGVVRGWLTGG